jgi:hypothetical protein
MMTSYTYVSRELVAKPGIYTQGDQYAKVEKNCLAQVCVITKTLKIKKSISIYFVDICFQEVNYQRIRKFGRISINIYDQISGLVKCSNVTGIYSSGFPLSGFILARIIY